MGRRWERRRRRREMGRRWERRRRRSEIRCQEEKRTTTSKRKLGKRYVGGRGRRE